ncbi:fibropellin-3-like [Ptychodera flava]|uniref:fibropellin-3-like n=1 Tax=Ptychodera flava TaxID=63121 RepID=UPI00396A7461
MKILILIFSSVLVTICVVEAQDINECESAPCQNGGFCSNLLKSYSCTCLGGYTGVNCELDINECASLPCLNAGTCNNLQNAYSCICVDGWTGVNCETGFNECGSSPCLNGGTCVDRVNAFNCLCHPGWIGTQCETDFNECGSNPCINGGTCEDLVNAFNCICPAGWIGTRCEIEMNPCNSVPCQNGGICNNFFTFYTCDCPSAYAGINCELVHDPCASLPCQNGGTCSSVPGPCSACNCHCPVCYTGLACETLNDPCRFTPCTNGGTCMLMPTTAMHLHVCVENVSRGTTVKHWSTHATQFHVKMAASVLQCQAHAQNIHAHVPAAAGLVNSVKSRLMFVTRTRVKMVVSVLQSRIPVLPTSVPALTVSKVSTVNKCLILVHQIRVPMAVHALRRDARHRDASALTAMKEITVFSWSTHATQFHVKMAASVLQCQAHAQNIHAHVPAAAGLVTLCQIRKSKITLVFFVFVD